MADSHISPIPSSSTVRGEPEAAGMNSNARGAPLRETPVGTNVPVTEDGGTAKDQSESNGPLPGRELVNREAEPIAGDLHVGSGLNYLFSNPDARRGMEGVLHVAELWANSTHARFLRVEQRMEHMHDTNTALHKELADAKTRNAVLETEKADRSGDRLAVAIEYTSGPALLGVAFVIFETHPALAGLVGLIGLALLVVAFFRERR